MEKLTFTFLIELFKFHSSRSVKRKTRFPRKENLKKCPSFEEQNGTRYILGNIISKLLSSAVFYLQNRVSDLL